MPPMKSSDPVTGEITIAFPAVGAPVVKSITSQATTSSLKVVPPSIVTWGTC